MRVLVIFVAFCCAVGADKFPGSSREGSDSREHGHHVVPKYSFGWKVHDGYSGNYQEREENRDGYNTQGYYRLLQPDGNFRTVTYRDDGNGFNADVAYSPAQQIGGNSRSGERFRSAESFERGEVRGLLQRNVRSHREKFVEVPIVEDNLVEPQFFPRPGKLQFFTAADALFPPFSALEPIAFINEQQQQPQQQFEVRQAVEQQPFEVRQAIKNEKLKAVAELAVDEVRKQDAPEELNKEGGPSVIILPPLTIDENGTVHQANATESSTTVEQLKETVKEETKSKKSKKESRRTKFPRGTSQQFLNPLFFPQLLQQQQLLQLQQQQQQQRFPQQFAPFGGAGLAQDLLDPLTFAFFQQQQRQQIPQQQQQSDALVPRPLPQLPLSGNILAAISSSNNNSGDHHHHHHQEQHQQHDHHQHPQAHDHHHQQPQPHQHHGHQHPQHQHQHLHQQQQPQPQSQRQQQLQAEQLLQQQFLQQLALAQRQQSNNPFGASPAAASAQQQNSIRSPSSSSNSSRRPRGRRPSRGTSNSNGDVRGRNNAFRGAGRPQFPAFSAQQLPQFPAFSAQQLPQFPPFNTNNLGNGQTQTPSGIPAGFRFFPPGRFPGQPTGKQPPQPGKSSSSKSTSPTPVNAQPIPGAPNNDVILILRQIAAANEAAQRQAKQQAQQQLTN